jgi:plastocyanin
MKRIRMLGVAGALAAVAAGGAAAATPKLVASVSDPVNISRTMGAKRVTSLKAGKYTIVVKDLASDHDFHLSGPGVNKRTSVAGRATTTWTVTLTRGTYRFMCDPHAGFMKGSFTVK